MNTNDIIDISMDLDGSTVVWPEDNQPELRPVARIPGQPCNYTWLSFGSHAGTHVDAPFYLFNEGWTSDKIPFDRLIGSCQVLDLSSVESTITLDDIAQHEIHKPIVLLKTNNSYDPMRSYNPEHIELSPEAARHLVDAGVKTLGYDYQSFERSGKVDLHRLFLSKGIILLDNLRLAHVEPGDYELICLPLKVIGIDGAPARAVLVREK